MAGLFFGLFGFFGFAEIDAESVFHDEAETDNDDNGGDEDFPESVEADEILRGQQKQDADDEADDVAVFVFFGDDADETRNDDE